jgi:hypothetical protein
MCDDCNTQLKRIPELLEDVDPGAREHVAIQMTKRWAFEAAGQHEDKGCARSPAGEACWHNRANVLAYIAHALGFTPAMFDDARKILEKYEHHHVADNGAEG